MWRGLDNASHRPASPIRRCTSAVRLRCVDAPAIGHGPTKTHSTPAGVATARTWRAAEADRIRSHDHPRRLRRIPGYRLGLLRADCRAVVANVVERIHERR